MHGSAHVNTNTHLLSEGLGCQISRFNTGALWEAKNSEAINVLYFQHFIGALFEYTSN